MLQVQFDILVDGDKSQVAVCLEDTELRILERYVACCERLEDTILSCAKIEPIRMGLNEHEGIVFSVKTPRRKDVAHALHELRPLVLQGEPTQFENVKKVTSRRIPHSGVRKYLKFLQRYYDLRPAETDPVPPQAGFAFGIENCSFDTSTEGDLRKYLNAFEYHRDDEKAAAIRQTVGEPNMEVLQQGILFALMQRVGVILELRSLCDVVVTRGRAFSSSYGWRPQLFVRQTPQ